MIKMNMQSLMMQAKKMQKDIEKSQKELENKEYTGKSQLVSATINGANKLLSVKIDMDEFSIDDKEMLEDMIILAVNDAINQMEKDKEDKFGKYGQMFNGLM